MMPSTFFSIFSRFTFLSFAFLAFDVTRRRQKILKINILRLDCFYLPFTLHDENVNCEILELY